MDRGEIRAQQLGVVGGHGRPGEKPAGCETGISSAVRAELGKYANPQVASRVNDVVDRKRGVAVINSWPVA
jgi:hypothetical protein